MPNTTIQRPTFTKDDADFAVISCAVTRILNITKPKKRARLMDDLLRAAQIAGYSVTDVAKLPAVQRAGECLAEAVRRYGEAQSRLEEVLR